MSGRRRRWASAVLVGVVVTAAYVVYGAWQWAQFSVKSWDLAIFAQAMQHYAAAQPPVVSVKGDGFNLLGDHFHPLLAVLAPVYAVLPHAFTLVVVQAACFGIAAAVFARAAQRVVGGVTGVGLGLAFGFAWGLQYASEVQFHEVALAVPLLTVSLVAAFERRWLSAALWAAPLVFVKEDLGLTVVAVGVLIIIRARKPLGLWLVAWGLGWFAVATLLVLPLLNPDGAWAYGASANPGAVFSDPAGLFDPSKGHTLLLIVAVTAGLVLRSPFALVLLPTLAWRFLSSNHGYWGPSWHYSAVLIPVAFCAMLGGSRGADAFPAVVRDAGALRLGALFPGGRRGRGARPGSRGRCGGERHRPDELSRRRPRSVLDRQRQSDARLHSHRPAGRRYPGRMGRGARGGHTAAPGDAVRSAVRPARVPARLPGVTACDATGLHAGYDGVRGNRIACRV